MATILATLTTTLEASADFGLWTGYPLLTSEVLSSEFTYDVTRGFSTTLIESSIFSASTDPQRSLVTTLVEKSIFSGSLLNIRYPNTPIPDLIVPPPIVPVPPLPHGFTDNGKRTPLFFEIYFQSILFLRVNAPEFGDVETLQKIHVKEYTRGNTLISFRVAAWGEEKIFEYSFNRMSNFEKEVILNIYRNMLGIKLTIIDHLGITRIGFILTPDSEVIESTRRGFSTTFRFQQVD